MPFLLTMNFPESPCFHESPRISKVSQGIVIPSVSKYLRISPNIFKCFRVFPRISTHILFGGCRSGGGKAAENVRVISPKRNYSRIFFNYKSSRGALSSSHQRPLYSGVPVQNSPDNNPRSGTLIGDNR